MCLSMKSVLRSVSLHKSVPSLSGEIFVLEQVIFIYVKYTKKICNLLANFPNIPNHLIKVVCFESPTIFPTSFSTVIILCMTRPWQRQRRREVCMYGRKPVGFPLSLTPSLKYEYTYPQVSIF